MNYYKITGNSTKHFCKPGEIVFFTGFEYREGGELFLMVVNGSGLKQLVKKCDLIPERIPQRNEIELNNEQLINRYYEASF